LRVLVGTIGAWIIYGLIWLFGRKHERGDVGWLLGPLGGPTIGDRSYEETALAEGLTIERNAREGGLIPRFDALAGPSFDPARVHPKIRDFYERTPAYRLDTWATTYFPARLALWALVTTISRRVQQVVFPMPDGNATVLLRPENDGESGLRLASIGSAFGDAGFYRVQRAGPGEDAALRVWRITSLHETFRLYLDAEETVRCEHQVRFLGMPVLTLHYRIGMAQGSIRGAPTTIHR
jgi:hypothetical protein